MTAGAGVGLFNNPVAGQNTGLGTTSFSSTAAGTSAAGLNSFERVHLTSNLVAVYSPIPGIVDIPVEWDHYERWTQAGNTWGYSNTFRLGANFYW
jgi:hypothetical protein